MKLLALIKKRHKLRTITDDDIRDSVNSFINMNIHNFIDKLDDDAKITIDSLNYLYSSNVPLSNYTADEILKRLIKLKKKREIERVLYETLEPYDVDEQIISYILENENFYNCFYNDRNGKVKIRDYVLENLFNVCFRGNGRKLLKLLADTVNSSDFSLEYYCYELRDYFSREDFKANIDKDNFERLLCELGEIQNRKDISSERHKCYDCDNLSPLICEKAEYVKKPISGYPFIESGYQIFYTNGQGEWEMDTFCVTHCRDYSYVRSNLDTGSKSKVKK